MGKENFLFRKKKPHEWRRIGISRREAIGINIRAKKKRGRLSPSFWGGEKRERRPFLSRRGGKKRKGRAAKFRTFVFPEEGEKGETRFLPEEKGENVRSSHLKGRGGKVCDDAINSNHLC